MALRKMTSFCLDFQVAGFVKGLPGCKEHAATFKTEVSPLLLNKTIALFPLQEFVDPLRVAHTHVHVQTAGTSPLGAFQSKK